MSTTLDELQCELCIIFVSSQRVLAAELICRSGEGVGRDNETKPINSHSPLAARCSGNVHEAEIDMSTSFWIPTATLYSPTVVDNSLLCPTLWGLLLFLFFDLGGLRLDLTGTGKRTVN